jgi:hypothetical protein
MFSIKFTNLSINFSWANIFGIQKWITGRISQLAGFSIFALISTQNDELMNKECELTMCLM